MSPFARLVPHMLRYRRQFGLGLVCLVFTTTLSLLGPWVLRFAIDDLTADVTRAKLGLYAGLLLGLAVVGGGFRFLMRRIIVGASRAIEYDLRNVFLAHLQRLPLAYFHANRTGDLMSRATNDLNAVRMMVGPAIMYVGNTGMVFVVSVALMLSIDPVLTVVALLPLPLVSVTVKTFGSAIYRQSERIQAQLSTLSAVVQESLAGVRVVRAYCREAVETERFRRENLEYLECNGALIRLQAIFYPNNPLHDLAVVIRGERIAAAKVQLPLAPPGLVPSQLGSRHRAAVGVTLDSDCVVIVVSEENGRIRFAENGELSQPVARDRVAEELARRLEVRLESTTEVAATPSKADDREEAA